MELIRFDTVEQACDYLCTEVTKRISCAVRDKGEAHLVLSGGWMPTQYLPKLAGSLDSPSRLSVSLSDERWVPITHSDSNEAMIRSCFSQHVPGARLTGMVGACRDASLDAAKASDVYAELLWPADISCLGVGPDGHIASLFPGLSSSVYDHEAAPVIVTEQPGSGQNRLSLSPQRLLMAGKILLMVNGDEKHWALERALEDGPVKALPLRHLLHQGETPVEVLIC